MFGKKVKDYFANAEFYTLGLGKIKHSYFPLSHPCTFLSIRRISLSDDFADILFSMDFGSCLKMFFGWLHVIYICINRFSTFFTD